MKLGQPLYGKLDSQIWKRKTSLWDSVWDEVFEIYPYYTRKTVSNETWDTIDERLRYSVDNI